MATEEEWACLRKRRYHSRKKARDAARHAQAQTGRVHAYRCPFGRPAHWHVGHDWRERDSTRALSSTP